MDYDGGTGYFVQAGNREQVEEFRSYVPVLRDGVAFVGCMVPGLTRWAISGFFLTGDFNCDGVGVVLSPVPEGEGPGAP
jgi:hypothetical protein